MNAVAVGKHKIDMRDVEHESGRSLIAPRLQKMRRPERIGGRVEQREEAPIEPLASISFEPSSGSIATKRAPSGSRTTGFCRSSERTERTSARFSQFANASLAKTSSAFRATP